MVEHMHNPNTFKGKAEVLGQLGLSGKSLSPNKDKQKDEGGSWKNCPTNHFQFYNMVIQKCILHVETTKCHNSGL